MVVSMWISHYDHQLNAVHDLIFYSYIRSTNQGNSSLVVELES